MHQSINEQAVHMLQQIEREIESNRLVLPSLPEVALRVRQLIADTNCDARDLEREIAKDATITARLIKVANSSATRRGQSVNSLKGAITTLGFTLVRSFVTQIAILQLMNNEPKNPRLLGFVASSMSISAMSNSLAAPLPGIDPEHAALAGLLHDIGKLPLRSYFKGRRDLSPEQALELELLLHPEVGAILLRHWNMDETLVAVAREHELIFRNPGPKADYVDVIIAANVLHYGTETGRYASYADTLIPAVSKCTMDHKADAMAESTEQRMAFALTLIST